MAAFTSTVPIKLRNLHSTSHRFPSRPSECTCKLLPALSAPPSAPQLKQRSVIALRAFSDIASLTLLNELAHRFILTSNPVNAFTADCELLLGVLLGVWTAAAFAERLKLYTSNLISQSSSSDIVNSWDDSFIYSHNSDNIHPDEIQSTITWLYSFNEIEGPETIELLISLSLSKDPLIRTRLLNALALFPIRTNVTLSIIVLLASDYNAQVKKAALFALSEYEKVGIVTFNDPSTILPRSTATSQDLLLSSKINNDSLWTVKNILQSILKDPCPIPVFSVYQLPTSPPFNELIQRQIDNMKDMALSCPDLPNFSSVATNLMSSSPSPSPATNQCAVNALIQQQLDSIFTQQKHKRPPTCDHSHNSDSNQNLPAPLIDSLCTQEIHGICALALLPTAYEIFALVQHQALPLRFLGLGWLFSVGGLAAYPNSANLWSSFSQTIEKLPGEAQ